MTPSLKLDPVIVVEDDYFTRILQVVLDSKCSAERYSAYADFFAHDEPDFDGWVKRVKGGAESLTPSDVRLVSTQDELRARIADADIVLIESFSVGPEELAAARKLRIVQRFGTNLRNVSQDICVARGIEVRGHRRRANIACAEHVFLFMLMMARQSKRVDGIVTVERAKALGFEYRPFDRRHTANANWPRIPGMVALNESTLGIIGVGEIGQEVALRAKAFGMNTLYFQRTRLAAELERELNLSYVSLETLLQESDFVAPLLPNRNTPKDLLGERELPLMKRGAYLINISRPEVVNKKALLGVLREGHLGGFALDPQYKEPYPEDEELLSFSNVLLTPHTAAQPRFNALRDLHQLITGLSSAFEAKLGGSTS